MAWDADYITLQRKVADDTGGRTDLLTPLAGSGLTTSPVQDAIQSAIAKYEREPFYFNQFDGSPTPFFSTVVGQENYAAPASPAVVSSPKIYGLRVVVSGTSSRLRARPWEELADLSTISAARGQPTEWAYFGQTIRLYPIPGAVYSILAERLARFDPLVLDADANGWTQDGFDLIKAEACLHLALHVTHDEQMAAKMMTAIHGMPQMPRGLLYALKAETTRRSTGKIKPTQF